MGQSYEASSVLADAASAGWLAHAGLVTETEHHDEQFMFRDSHGAPMANMAYTAKFKSTGEVIHGMTDDTGQTERLKSKAAGPDDIEITWGHQ